MVTRRWVAWCVTLCALAAVLSGCGKRSGQDEVAQLAVRQSQLERGLTERLDAVVSKLDAVAADVSALRAEVGSLRTLAARETETRGGQAPGPVEGGTSTEAAPTGIERIARTDDAYLNLMAEMETLRLQISELQGSIRAMGTEAAEREERARLRDPRESWQVLGEPEQLAKRLDTLASSFSPQIEDAGLREQFKADLEALKTSLLNPGTVEERLERQRQKMQEQLATETNEQARRWIERRLETLNRSDKETLAALLENYMRFDNSQELRKLSEKYKIPRQVLQDAGLPAWGGTYGTTITVTGG